jgi:hypothetical protein
MCLHAPFLPGLGRAPGSTPRVGLASHGTIKLLRRPWSMLTAVSAVAWWPHDFSG